MEFKEFTNQIMTGLKAHYGTEVEVTLQEVVKTNDTVLHGVVIRTTGKVSTAVPILYLDQYYEKLMDGSLCFEDILSEIEEEWQNGSQNVCTDGIMDVLTDWEKAKEKVYPILLSAERNRSLLDGFVTTDFLDLKVAYVLQLDVTGKGEGIGTTRVKEEMLETFDITAEELHEQALQNLRKEGIGYYRMEDILFNLTGDEDEIQPVETLEKDGMYCLCNKSRHYGAACLLATDLLKKAADGRNCFIIPSSIHEVLILPENGTLTQETLNEMVRNVNAAEVSAEEVLSDHAYYFNSSTGEIQLSA